MERPRSGPPPANEPPSKRSGGSPALTATWRPRVQVLLSDLLYVALARRLVVRGGGEDLPLESLPLLCGGRVDLQHRLGKGRVKGHLHCGGLDLLLRPPLRQHTQRQRVAVSHATATATAAPTAAASTATSTTTTSSSASSRA